jgi:hypothetical protein
MLVGIMTTIVLHLTLDFWAFLAFPGDASCVKQSAMRSPQSAARSKKERCAFISDAKRSNSSDTSEQKKNIVLR